MSKCSISVWKSARANELGLPECPPDMIEPQWASLLFSQHCHVSGLSDVVLLVYVATYIKSFRCVLHLVFGLSTGNFVSVYVPDVPKISK